MPLNSIKKKIVCAMTLMSVFPSIGLCWGGETLHIDKQVQLSPGHRVMPYKIMRMTNGDLIVLGSNDSMDYKPWATRIGPSGEVRWEFIDGGADGWSDRSVRAQRFYGAVDLPDDSTILCGIKRIDNRSTLWLVKLDPQGKVLSEKLIEPVREHVVNSLYSCHKRSDGIVLMGSVSGQPSGTGWMAKFDWDFNLQWKKFSDDFGLGEYIEAGDSLIALGWHSQEYYLVRLGPDGDVLNKTLIPGGEHHLVQGDSTSSSVKIVMMLPEFKHTDILTFDNQLRGPKSTVKLSNVGVKSALALSDGTIAIFGSQFTDSATAAVTRVYKDGQYKTLRLEPLHESPWYIDAVLTGKGNQIVAVRQMGVEQGVLDFITLK